MNCKHQLFRFAPTYHWFDAEIQRCMKKLIKPISVYNVHFTAILSSTFSVALEMFLANDSFSCEVENIAHRRC